MRRARVALATLAALVAVTAPGACAKQPTWPPRPAPVRLGEDACASCRMLISEERFGAQVHDRAGRVDHYDDVGCLAEHGRRATFDPQGAFVRPYGGGAWIPAGAAWVVRAADIRSPMGSGLAAFPSEAEARAEAGRHDEATVLPLAELLRGGEVTTR